MEIPRGDLLRFSILCSRLAEVVTKKVQTFADLALLDHLTGILNRRGLLSRIDQEIARSIRYGRPLTLAIVDLDKFKGINDTLGHMSGDTALKILANVLNGHIRKADIVGRYGGDEFIVVFTETPASAAGIPLERIRQTIEASTFELEGKTSKFTISVGVAELPLTPGFTAKQLIELADAALYRAKEKGRNRIEVA